MRRSIPARDVADRLHSAAVRLIRGLRRVDVASGLGPARLSALSVLVFADAPTLGELAAIEQVRPPTMTRIVQGLEADGLVLRRPDPNDGRKSRLRPTRKGRRLMLLARDRRVALLRTRLDRLGAAEHATLERAVAILERL